MSVSFLWEVIEPSKKKRLGAGTSSDIDALKQTFGETITVADLSTLRAMHRIAAGIHDHKTLWGEIADTLERLSEADPEVAIRVWPEF